MKSSIKAAVFDAYGTLFDVHAAVRAHAARVGPLADSMSALWRTKQLEYTWVRSLMGRHADFAQVTGEALDHAMASFGVSGAELRADLLAAYRALSAFADAPACLDALIAQGKKCAILSNGTPEWLASAVRAAGLDARVAAVWSVEEVGIFKPDARVYRLATQGLKLEASEIGFVSSNPWDAAGAANFGFQAVWINRNGLPGEYASIAKVPQVASLGDLARYFG
jgi:2-haloacid dehalogenase